MSGKIFRGESFSIPFTEDGVVKGFEIEGKTEQKTRSGKNKFNVNDLITKVNFLTDINFDTSSFIVSNSWATTIMNNAQILSMLKPNSSYKIIADVTLLSKPDDVSSSSNHQRLLMLWNGTTGANVLQVASTDEKNNWQVNEKKHIKCSFTTPASLENYKLLAYCYHMKNTDGTSAGAQGFFKYENVMILDNSEINESFEAYGKMPSPDFPSEIRNIGDNINFYNINEPITYGSGSLRATLNDDETITTTSNYSSSRNSGSLVELEKNTDYTVSFLLNSINTTSGNKNGRLEILAYSEDDTYKAVVKGLTFSHNNIGQIIEMAFNSGDNTKWALHISGWFGSGNTGNINYQDVMLKKGTTTKPYSKFGCGSIGIKVQNKNFASTKIIKEKNLSAFTNITENEFTIDLSKDTISILQGNVDVMFGNLNPSKQYVLSYRRVKNNNSFNPLLRFTYTDGTYSSFENYNPSIGDNNIITISDKNKTISHISFVWNTQADGGLVKFSNIMLREIDTDDSYVEHKEQEIIFPLEEGQVLHDGDWVDQDGIHQLKTIIPFTGTENITIYNSDDEKDGYAITYNTIQHPIKSYQPNDKSTHFIHLGHSPSWGREINKFAISENGHAYVFFEKGKVSTVAAMQEWIINQKNNGTPFIIEGTLKEEKLIPLTLAQAQVINNLPAFGPLTYYSTTNELKPSLVVNSANFMPNETEEQKQIIEQMSNEETRIDLEIWTQDDKFVDTLYNADYEFEGQCINPQMTINGNGAKTLSLSLPLYIFDKKTGERIKNPRWEYIIHQYKIRVKQDDRINEFVLRDYTESHDENDQLMININAQSLEEFELSQIGYNIVFDEQTLYKYNTNDNPNDPDTIPIGNYEPDIHFWNSKLLENSDWDYRVESYYPIDKEMDEDNRQVTNPESELKTGKEQFYEEDRIIDYTEDNKPVYSEQYEIKKRILKAEKSNIWNIAQDICETFECWPTFEIKYENGKIVKKTIVYKNDVPEDAKFSINYMTNLKSIQRTVDSSQIVTKMYVTPIQNENVDNGTITIATNPKNYMKESYLLDLSWYLGDKRTDTDIENTQLIDPKIGMHFAGTNFSTPVFTTIDTDKTKDTIKIYQENIRRRNTYLENLSLEISKQQEELTNLKTEREYVSSEKDAAQEQVNTLIDEMSLIGPTELRKENKACYLYKEDGKVIIRFSEIGIKNIPNSETFNSPINIVGLDGIPFYETGKVPEGTTNWKNIKTLNLVIRKVDPIIGTVLECEVTNATIGTNTDADYASFKCSFDYDPYEYYKKLISYWRAKVQTAEDRLAVLGKSRDEGGNSGLIYNLEGDLRENKRYLYQAQQQKAQIVKEFEGKFSPFIREGYWENTDFGIYKNITQELTAIPEEKQTLKYGQTEDSTSSAIDKYNWTKDYASFLIPNVPLNSTQGGSAYLYNVIDINEIEVMSDNPLNANDTFKVYVRGTDYTVEYGYTSNEPGVSNENRGIYIKFYEPEVNTNTDYIPQFTANTQIYIRVKARGTTNYIWDGYRKAEYYQASESGQTVQKRCWYCPLEQRITITDSDIILSSIIVKANTVKVNYNSTGQKVIENTQYELLYGKDYYTSKEIVDGTTVSRITLVAGTNVPLMDFTYANYIVNYNQDITAKYYFNDALDIMKESSIPQTTYSINVADISEARNFLVNLKWYKPQVGTRVPIYDEELRFYGLVGFINSVTFDLLSPQNTQLSITNFKDKFVDLFQKITASTIALQQKEYEYDRSTKIVTVEGGINKEILKDTFERPDSNFTVSPNKNIVWDYSGITSTSDKINANGTYPQVKVTPNGIFTSDRQDEFGNYVWTTAITPQGINASQLTIGKLDTRQIQIFNSSEPRFLWNENGLYAYGQNNGKTDYETYVLYNENGLKFRQLMKQTEAVQLPNLINSPTFDNYDYWSLSSPDGIVFDDASGSAEEIEVVGGLATPIYVVSVKSSKTTNKIILAQTSTKKDLQRNHKYYYRVYVKTNNASDLQDIDISAGFKDFYKNIQYSQNNQYVKIEGFVTGVTNENPFGVIVTLPNAKTNWGIAIKRPMILDVTEIFGETIPSFEWFSNLSDIEEIGSWETDLDVYGDALKLDWGGLSIGAQDNSLQLTSENGLVIYHPAQNSFTEKTPRLQLGQWTAQARDQYGNPITNGDEIVYEELYGLRALNPEGKMIFQISQHGVEFDFTNNLEDTIRNYSAEAALEAIASTNTSNLLKNSVGYVYAQKEDENGQLINSYTFFDWERENEQYLFPIDEKSGDRDMLGKAIVEGTVSKHAFKMGGDNATGLKPKITQNVSTGATLGVKQPFTLKFLMKGISNMQTSEVKNGIHLEMYEAGNDEDIDVDIPYIANGEWQQVKYTIYTEMPIIKVSISNISTITVTTVDGKDIPTNGIIYLSDLMMTSGKDTPLWTVSPGEVYNNYVTIGSEGVVVTSSTDSAGSRVRTVMDSHSFRVETIDKNQRVSTNINVDGDNTILGTTWIRGRCDIGDTTRLRFIENSDLKSNPRNPGIDITLIKG